MEWSESCAHIVRIGARVDERNRKLEVAVLHCEQQRARRGTWPSPKPTSPAGRVLRGLRHRIHIGARLEKRAHGVEVAPTHGKEECRKTGTDCRVQFASGLDQLA